MRAHHLCAALGLPTDKNKVEGFRSKLKRLVERGWLAEDEPGLFAWGGAHHALSFVECPGSTFGSRCSR
ncbi:hypothetical protein [Streptomyces ureilyticus]|uniref:Uncharacterized protein n=1 Tax=Streptomyces ureilyticus TaxID=1775131 RepID=A0ABX0DPR1_9ACTN|nr:hypothetical protein [Streptomyces ureilyticus]NGO43365.1 hypothetical protein [Streptomyces ureilyticus]